MTNANALIYDKAFRDRADRRQTWGVFLLLVALGIWLWVAYQLLAPFSISGTSHDLDCGSRVFYDAGESGRKSYAEAEGQRCAAERDLADPLALLLLALPFAVGGAFQYASGTFALRMSEHAAEVARLEAARES
ncbi:MULTISPECIES: hypothetical protein [unclassified Streptomyces]|uniref:hypothetical protein n=1 Tax=unclassified Streptomyces TaxID=2593676 RepID=UPI001BE596BE|nr:MULTISPECIES: hypothetical protein [unclassified Streptomyces]MBT2406627.1 hypothetical protein [Streptomyces sp. ISL-21]MBT2613713.1 hypothetical protein [Streptomyces sp. ISL-87]